MTNNEAITWLRGIRDQFTGNCTTDTLVPISRCDIQAIELAIKALEQSKEQGDLQVEPVINIQELLDEDTCKEFLNKRNLAVIPAETLIALQLACGKARPHGEWINRRTQQHDGEYYCSNCDFELESFIEGVFYRYCPNCGAEMVETHNELDEDRFKGE